LENTANHRRSNYDKKLGWCNVNHQLNQKILKLIASKILFYCGDTLSNFLYFEWMGAVLYPVYKKLMIWSSELDKEGKIWHNVDDENHNGRI